MRGTMIELGIENNFVSQLQRAQLIDDTRSDQAHDTTRSQEKGDATSSQAVDVDTVMIETLMDISDCSVVAKIAYDLNKKMYSKHT